MAMLDVADNCCGCVMTIKLIILEDQQLIYIYIYIMKESVTIFECTGFSDLLKTGNCRLINTGILFHLLLASK